MKLRTLENHILKTFAVDFHGKDNPVREKPEGKGKIVNLTKKETFRPLEIRGKWLKVGWESSKREESILTLDGLNGKRIKKLWLSFFISHKIHLKFDRSIAL